MISTSEIKVSVVIEEKYLELAVRALHTALSWTLRPDRASDARPGRRGLPRLSFFCRAHVVLRGLDNT